MPYWSFVLIVAAVIAAAGLRVWYVLRKYEAVPANRWSAFWERRDPNEKLKREMEEETEARHHRSPSP